MSSVSIQELGAGVIQTRLSFNNLLKSVTFKDTVSDIVLVDWARNSSMAPLLYIEGYTFFEIDYYQVIWVVNMSEPERTIQLNPVTASGHSLVKVWGKVFQKEWKGSGKKEAEKLRAGVKSLWPKTRWWHAQLVRQARGEDASQGEGGQMRKCRHETQTLSLGADMVSLLPRQFKFALRNITLQGPAPAESN